MRPSRRPIPQRFSERGDTGAAAARTLIGERWAEIDSSTWGDRAERGDKAVWREMLVGYYAGAVSPAALWGPLQSAERFAAAPYQHLGEPLRALQCEASFYMGLFESVSEPTATRRARAVEAFERALRTEYRLYFEYHMARLVSERYRRR